MNGQDLVPSTLIPDPQPTLKKHAEEAIAAAIAKRPRPTPSPPLTLEDECFDRDQLLGFMHWSYRKYLRMHALGLTPPEIRIGKQRLWRRATVLTWVASLERPNPKAAMAAARPRGRPKGSRSKRMVHPLDVELFREMAEKR